MWRIIAVVIALFGLSGLSDADIPSYIKVCKSNDPNIADCIKDSVEKLRPKLKEGIPELKVPPIEPLILDEVKLRSGPNVAKIDANITNIHVWGPSDFQITSLKPNIPKARFVFSAVVPSIYFSGDYDIDMSILLIKYKGKGPITGNFTNYSFDCILKGKKVVREGKTHLEFGKMTVRLNIGKSFLQLGNLFDGRNEVLARATNSVVSENSDIFIKEIRPNLESALAQKFTDIANVITSSFTYEELFPEQ